MSYIDLVALAVLFGVAIGLPILIGRLWNRMIRRDTEIAFPVHIYKVYDSEEEDL